MMHVLVPTMPTADDLLPYLREIDATRVYTNRGPLLLKLEAAATVTTGAPSVAVANCTLGLIAALRALGLPPGSQVVIPAATFRATGLAVIGAGLSPVLCDVDPGNWHMTPALARDCVNWGGPIAAFMPVATFGAPLDLGAWEDFARAVRRPVVIDAAGAFGAMRASQSQDVHLVYSLHATKHIGAGEGGIVSSNNARFLARVRELIAFGEGGTNAKLSEYHAAVALASMQSSFRLRKSVIAEMLHQNYLRFLPENCNVQRTPARSNHHMFSVLTPLGAGAIIEGLREQGIEARQWYRPYLDELPQFDPCPQPIGLDVTQNLRARLVGLPFHMGMSPTDVFAVCDALASVIRVPA